MFSESESDPVFDKNIYIIRILINDNKPDGRETAFAINLERNKGIDDIIL